MASAGDDEGVGWIVVRRVGDARGVKIMKMRWVLIVRRRSRLGFVVSGDSSATDRRRTEFRLRDVLEARRRKRFGQRKGSGLDETTRLLSLQQHPRWIKQEPDHVFTWCDHMLNNGSSEANFDLGCYAWSET
ncbi:hypothetical protein RvY_16067 [Ramazzottius varieornatus]|uniref:Uncharacterized protein n=1 Tax=Ramazzottius varieornatus TaxID=947166 RepID=A0A1D1VX56_RAMVA|nr:hypothetical protein RvY_16067 [Ramazzottius varieornatus]